MTFYQTIFLFFLIGICVIWLAQRLWPDNNNWQHSLITISGAAMIGVIGWLLLQILIGLPSLAQSVDLPAIFLGLLIAYGFQNAFAAIKNRAKNKLK